MLNFVIFVVKKKEDNKFFSPSLLLLLVDPGSQIRDPGWINIRIRIRNTAYNTSGAIHY